MPRSSAGTSTEGARPPKTPLRWGERVRHERTVRGWTQADLAERADVTRQQVSRLEAGSRRVADDVRVRIATVFALPTVEVFPYSGVLDDDGPPPRLLASA